MNALQFLSNNDFSLQPGKKGNLLCNRLKNVSIVLFFSKQCSHCHNVFPIFQSLARNIPNCIFAVLNITNYFDVAEASKKTIAPITHVPYIVLYVNGRPFLRYNGEKTENAIAQFVLKVLDHVENKKNFHTMKIDHEDEIPAYSIAIPFNVVCEGDECYLKFEDAYPGKERPPQQSQQRQNQGQVQGYNGPVTNYSGGRGQNGRAPNDLQGSTRMNMRSRSMQSNFNEFSGM